MTNNIGSICTTLQCQRGNAHKTALRLVNPDLSRTDHSFGDLDCLSNRFANLLEAAGVRPGEVVLIFLPKQLEVFTSFLGTLKHRSIGGILFSNFGKEALLERMLDCSARVLVTKQSLFGKIKDIWPQLPALEKVILTDLDQHHSERVLSYSQLMAQFAETYTPAATDPQDPAILHYTSGSTGKPKGVLHVHGAIEHHLRTMDEVLQVEEDDIYWCTADQAWVTGVTYGIIGPWAKGITQVHYAGNFGAVEWFEILKQEKVTIWYTAPTALRMLIQQQDLVMGKYDLPFLKRVYSVGEPLNPEIQDWVERVMRKDVYDTWFQTETGGIMIANRPGLPIRKGSMGKPLSTISAAVISDDDQVLPPDRMGNLRLRKGWPSMFRTYLNMQQTYDQKFHGDYYDTGDQARIDTDGYFWFVGRLDDVINTSGHLVGPFEVESALMQLDEVVDVAVFGAPDEMLYEKIVACLVLKEGCAWSKTLEVKCRVKVSTQISPVAVPSEFIITDKIPKNRSGKIMRRVMRARFLNLDAGDISTMED